MSLFTHLAMDAAFEGVHLAGALSKKPSSVLGRFHRYYSGLSTPQKLGIAAAEGAANNFLTEDASSAGDRIEGAAFDAGVSMITMTAVDYTLKNHKDKIEQHFTSIKDYVMKAGYAAPENSPVKLPKVKASRTDKEFFEYLEESQPYARNTKSVVDREQARAVTHKLRRRDSNPGDIAKEEVKVVAKNTMEELEGKALRKARGLKVLGGLGVAAFGVATLLDVNNKLEDKKKVSRDQRQEDRNLQRQESQQRKAVQDLLGGYGHVDMGQMAIDLFNQRTGHYKMGNAKFK